MATILGSASLQINLEHTWGDGGTWANNPQVHWGPMIECSATLFENTTSVTFASDLSSTATQTANGRLILAGASDLSSSATQSAACIRIRPGSADLSGAGTQLTVGKTFLAGSASLSASATMTTVAKTFLAGASSLSATATLVPFPGGVIHPASANLSGAGTQLTVGRITIIFESPARTFKIPAPKTTYTIQGLTRVNTIDAEIRNFTLPKLTRTIKVKREIREYATNHRL